jgi:hypothetical protein
MSARRRRRLFALAALVVMALAATAGAPRESGPATVDSRSVPAATDAVIVGAHQAARPARRRESPGRFAHAEDRRSRPTASNQAALRQATDAARRFAGALLRAELGERGNRVRAALRASAGRRLRKLVLEARPRPVAAGGPPGAGRLAAVTPSALSGRKALFVATIERGGRRSGLALTLTRERGLWRVVAIR